MATKSPSKALASTSALLVTLLLTTLILTGCSDAANPPGSNAAASRPSGSTEPQTPANSNNLTELLAQAETNNAEARKLNNEWTVVNQYVEQARQAETAGDKEQALAFARRAAITAEASVDQAKQEASAWRARFRSSFNIAAQ